MSVLSEIGNRSAKTATSVVSNALNAAITLGKSALHTLMPDNYEYYMCSLELRDYSKNKIGFISFIVMPNNLSESRQPIQTQTKTKNGIVTLFNDSFTPVNIAIQGTFGRKFRLVSGLIDPMDASDKKITNFLNGNWVRIKNMTVGAKSGYGLTKVLKYILDKSLEVDSNNHPYVLVFTNYSFHTSYVVDLINYSFSQSTENNMMWFYDIQLKGIAPGSAIKTAGQSNGSLLQSVASNAICQGLTKVVNDVKRNNILKYI